MLRTVLGTVLPNSAPILERLTRLHPKVIDLSLGRIERLLDALGRPQDRLPPVVHVAGTNGKGSVIAFLRAMLEAAGRSVHVYTSPHLVRFSERIVVAGAEIADASLAELLEACEQANGGRPITFFEITTAAALLAFARSPADVTLLETGLGGRLDASNVVARPAVTAITPVSLDHQAFLGDTLAAIAGEKAGILKPQVPCVLARQPAAADAVIRARASALRAPLDAEGSDWQVAGGPGGLQYWHAREGPQALPSPALPGAHQLQNAGTAIACLRHLAPWLPARVDDAAIGRGLRSVRWPARLQQIRDGRLPALLPEGWELWLDGGHNPGAAAVLARHLQEWRDRPLLLVFGMLKTKDAAGFLAPLAAHARRAVSLDVPGEAASLTAAEAAALAGSLGVPAAAAPGIVEALQRLAAEPLTQARVLICGSLYLAGAVLRANAPGP